MIRWHAWNIKCPDCNLTIFIKSIAFNANGECQVDGVCAGCNRDLEWFTEWGKVVSACHLQDQIADKADVNGGSDESKNN